MLQPFGQGIWIADGPQVIAAAGFHYPTRMAVMRLSAGGLLVWSPVQLTPDLRAAVDALGPVAHIVAPNSLHHLAVPEWQAAYPAAKVYAAPGLRRKRPDIAFDADLGIGPAPVWQAEVDMVVFAGNRITTEVVLFHRASGTAIFTDLLQQFPKGWFSGWRAWVARLDLMTAPMPSVPRKFRVAQTDRQAAKRALRQILDWPVDKVLMAHGTPIEAGGHAALVSAFRWLR